jgi:hypothetical protein
MLANLRVGRAHSLNTYTSLEAAGSGHDGSIDSSSIISNSITCDPRSQ